MSDPRRSKAILERNKRYLQQVGITPPQDVEYTREKWHYSFGAAIFVGGDIIFGESG